MQPPLQLILGSKLITAPPVFSSTPCSLYSWSAPVRVKQNFIPAASCVILCSEDSSFPFTVLCGDNQISP